MKLPRLSMVHVLLGALVIGAAIAVYESTSTSAPSAPPETKAPQAPVARESQGDEATETAAASTIEGEVLEVLDVPEYTYARVGARGTEGTWTAFPSTPIKTGQHLRLRDAMRMNDFSSKILKRTFATIWFGNLDDGSGAANPHVAMGGAKPPVEPMQGGDPHGGDPHGGDPQGGAVTMHAVDRAPGPNGKTVAEIVAGRTELTGKTVRVRAIVVKRTSGVLGHDYLHVRDGSGDDAAHTNDLSVATDAQTAVGDTVLLEGVLTLDANIGSGFTFPTLLSDAKIIP